MDWSRRFAFTSASVSDFGWCLISRAWSSSQERKAMRSFWKSQTVLGADILCVARVVRGTLRNWWI